MRSGRQAVLLSIVIGLAFTGAELAAWIGRARADGAPADEPLRFSGTITEGGVRINDREKPIAVVIWRSADLADRAELCRTTPRGGVNVTDGRFSVVLDPACAVALRGNPNAWVEVEVDGTPYGRQRIGAVPYALEADRATNAAHADDGVPVGGMMLWDGSACPAGWSAVPEYAGRMLLATAPGTSVGSTVGVALLDGESRALPAHGHSFSARTGAVATIFGFDARCCGWADGRFVTDTDAFETGGYHHNHDVSGGTTAISAGETADLAPYVQVLLCRRDG